MPGIVGFRCARVDDPDAVLAEAAEQMRHGRARVDPCFRDVHVAATRVHLGFLDAGPSPVEHVGCHVWIHGEAHGVAAAASACGLAASRFGAALAEATRRRCLASLLDRLDGVFAAAIYDATERRVHLVTDRLGVQPLYVWQRAGRLAWAGEVKAFFALPGFSPTALAADAFKAMIEVGHMVGDLTWYDEVKLLPAGCIRTFALEPLEHVGDVRYWSWRDVEPLSLSFDDAVVALEELIRTVVDARWSSTPRLGVSLSGGLDSRAILAALGERAVGLPTYTLGQASSRDVRFARAVASAAQSHHREWILTPLNWCRGRTRAVWHTDGMANVRHHHYTPFHRELQDSCDINLNGYLGGAILGTSYLGSRRRNERIDADVAGASYGALIRHDDPADPFYDLDHVEPYFINNRGRRMIGVGTVEIASTVAHRKPFIDRRILDFVFGLPDDYRDGGLYEKALMRLSPSLFGEVPCAKTGKSLTGAVAPDVVVAERGLLRDAPEGTSPFALADYDHWLRTEPFLYSARLLLDPKRCLMRGYVETDYAKHLEVHARGGKRYTEHVLRAVTIELWLRLVHGRDVPGVFADVD